MKTINDLLRYIEQNKIPTNSEIVIQVDAINWQIGLIDHKTRELNLSPAGDQDYQITELILVEELRDGL